MTEFGYATAETEMRYKCYMDIKKAHVDGSWWYDSYSDKQTEKNSYGTQFKNKPKPELNMLWRDICRAPAV